MRLRLSSSRSGLEGYPLDGGRADIRVGATEMGELTNPFTPTRGSAGLTISPEKKTSPVRALPR